MKYYFCSPFPSVAISPYSKPLGGKPHISSFGLQWEQTSIEIQVLFIHWVLELGVEDVIEINNCVLETLKW